ncbi:MAG: C-terminal binding protein [Halolamina sp.]
MAPVRIRHFAPDYFGDVRLEREVFERELGNVTMLTAGSVDGSAEILATFGSPVDGDLLEETGCSVVASYTTGVDHVDVEVATERGVRVCRVPEYCDREVGEHVLATTLALTRGLPQYDAETAAGGWDWTVANPLRTFDELTIGLLAFGRKARVVANLAAPLGFEVVAHDPYVDDEEIVAAGVEPVGFGELVERADVLSLHAPLTRETRGIIDADALGQLPDGAVLVNAARGELVDESALVDALENGSLAGAGLDVFDKEPPGRDNPLRTREDVIVTPHVAWNSEGAKERVRIRGSEIAAAAYRGEAVDGVVNPETC